MSKRKYGVTVRELLEREIIIEARSPEEAEQKANEMYEKQEIILDADDFTEYSIFLSNEDL